MRSHVAMPAPHGCKASPALRQRLDLQCDRKASSGLNYIEAELLFSRDSIGLALTRRYRTGRRADPCTCISARADCIYDTNNV